MADARSGCITSDPSLTRLAHGINDDVRRAGRAGSGASASDTRLSETRIGYENNEATQEKSERSVKPARTHLDRDEVSQAK